MSAIMFPTFIRIKYCSGSQLLLMLANFLKNKLGLHIAPNAKILVIIYIRNKIVWWFTSIVVSFLQCTVVMTRLGPD
jgi:hypothetical protein